jgi:hypothetical protein
MRRATADGRLVDAAAIGVTAYRTANGRERQLLERFLGPNAAEMARLKH